MIQEIIIALLVGMLGAYATYILDLKYHQGSVFSSAFSSLIFASSVLLLKPFLGDEFAQQLALIFFGASFVGMSSQTLINNNLTYLLASGFCFSIVFLLTEQCLVGYGGGLGFRALVAVLIVRGVSYVWQKLFNRLK